MIITVTLNPAVDKTADLTQFEHGGLNRLTNIINDAGGKGINVSKTIKALGGNSIATGFLGGSAGILIENALNELGIEHDFIKVSGNTRTNLKVVEQNGFVTELNEPGPEISFENMTALEEKLLFYASEDTIFVFAGSIPASVDKNAYCGLIRSVKEKGSKVFLDADGELFVKGLKAQPTIIKPNKAEVEEHFGMETSATEEELIFMGKKLLEEGPELVAVSRGAMGALFFTKDAVYSCPGLKVNAHSTVGAGDAMVAALTYGIDSKLTLLDCIRLGMATSAGAVTTKGTKPPTRELVDELARQVEIHTI